MTGTAAAWGWVAHLADGGTTPWVVWSGTAEPRGDRLPGAQNLELLRRLNLAGRPGPGLVEGVLAVDPSRRSRPALPLAGGPSRSTTDPVPSTRPTSVTVSSRGSPRSCSRSGWRPPRRAPPPPPASGGRGARPTDWSATPSSWCRCAATSSPAAGRPAAARSWCWRWPPTPGRPWSTSGPPSRCTTGHRPGRSGSPRPPGRTGFPTRPTPTGSPAPGEGTSRCTS